MLVAIMNFLLGINCPQESLLVVSACTRFVSRHPFIIAARTGGGSTIIVPFWCRDLRNTRAQKQTRAITPHSKEGNSSSMKKSRCLGNLWLQ